MDSKLKKKIGWFSMAFASVGLAAAAGIAAAHGNGMGGGKDREARKAEMLQKYDTNKDGVLDDTERAAMRADMKAKFEAKKADMLKKYDKNNDGTLDETERAAMRDDRITEEFSKADTNKDGKLSLDEVKAAIAAHDFGGGGREGFGGGFHKHGHHGHGRKGEGGERGGKGGQRGGDDQDND